ncbi:MAG: hypothetical protein EBX40_06835, partial [Gammaproteobacteria bacterium]|nr:hypothetical protein [Gammaproteobacteria bacterium]
MKFKVAASVIIASCLSQLALAGTYQQTIQVYNDSSNTIDVKTGYVGSDIINVLGHWKCGGDPQTGSQTACVSIAPSDARIPSKSSQTFTLESTLNDLTTAAWLSGAVLFNVNGVGHPDAQVNVPVEFNQAYIWATNITTPDSANIEYTLKAISLNDQAQHASVTSSVELQNN